MTKRIGVCLSGCGVHDGSEIYETVVTLLAIDRAGAQSVCMAPNITQHHVIDHSTGQEISGEARNVLVESARLARGEIRDASEIRAEDLDALIFPGGFGAAKNLCDFAFHGTDCKPHPEVERIVKEVHAAGKPIGAICIAPALVASIFRGAPQVQLTIGNDQETADALRRMGAAHTDCAVDNVVTDEENKIVSTPAYMLAGSISEAASGIEKLVAEVLRLA